MNDYQTNAATFAGRFEKVFSARLFSHVQHYLPIAPSNILDIGAGTGRDAAWFASQGHCVTAIEPVDALREYGQAQHGPGITWLTDTLPDLAKTCALQQTFEQVHLIAVWHHLRAEDQAKALARLSGLITEGGMLILSVKHENDDDRNNVGTTISTAKNSGLNAIFQVTAEAVQPENKRAGVTWTWLVFGKS